MKVIHENNYAYVGVIDGLYAFKSNPNKVDFDKEIILVERARYVKKDGTIINLNKEANRSWASLGLRLGMTIKP